MRIILAVLALSFAASARADVSDSGSLTIGQGGVIQGTMTVQGNAFSVGGSTFMVNSGSITLGGRLNAAVAGIKWADGTTSTTAASGATGNAILTATQTWSGANTFISSAVFGSGASKSTFTAAGLLMLPASGIQWADGSTSTSASSGSSISSVTVVYITTQVSVGVQDFGPCINRSTISLTISSGKAIVFASGTGQNPDSSNWGATYLIDGAFPTAGSTVASTSPLNNKYGISHHAGTLTKWAGFTHVLTNVSNGSHTFCLSFANDYSTLYIPNNNSNQVFSGITFGVMEIK